MASKPTNVNVQTNLRLLGPQDSAHAQVLYCKAVPDFSSCEFRLSYGEQDAVCRAMLKHTIGEANILTSLHKQSLLTLPKHQTSIQRKAGDKFVLLTLYMNEGKVPPYVAAFDYGSSCSASSHVTFEKKASQFKQTIDRSHRTHVFTCKAGRGYEAVLDAIHRALAPPDNPNLVRLYCFQMNVECTSLNTSDVLNSFAARRNFTFKDENHDIEIPRRLLSQVASATKSREPALNDTQQHSQIEHGLRLVPGTVQDVHSQADGAALVAERPHVYVLHMPRPYTVANFIQHQFGFATQSQEILAMLNGMLKGLQVSIGSRSSQEQRQIAEVWSADSINTHANQRHDACSKDPTELMIATLPCINVGTSQKPELLPADACSITENQELRGDRSPAFTRLIQSLREGIKVDASKQYQSKPGKFIPLLPGKFGKDENLKSIAKACGKYMPVLLFVEVGSHNQRLKSPTWTSLPSTLRNLLGESFPSAEKYGLDQECPVLPLDPNVNPGDSQPWIQRLHQFVSMYQESGRQTIVVVCLPSGKSRTDIYTKIKNLCDIDLGAQTFAVQRKTLQTKSSLSLDADEATAAELIAGDIRRRLRLRHPPMLSSGKGTEAPNHLVVAMHAVLHTPDASCISADGMLHQKKKNMVLVTLVSRSLGSSDNYHTESHLFSEREFNNIRQDVFTMLTPFFAPSKGSKPYSVTILRSGYQVDDDFSMNYERKAIFDSWAPAVVFNYITVSEDKLLKLHVDETMLSYIPDEGSAMVITHRGKDDYTDSQIFSVQNMHKKSNDTGVVKVAIHTQDLTPIIKLSTQTDASSAAQSQNSSPVRSQASTIVTQGQRKGSCVYSSARPDSHPQSRPLSRSARYPSEEERATFGDEFVGERSPSLDSRASPATLSLRQKSPREQSERSPTKSADDPEEQSNDDDDDAGDESATAIKAHMNTLASIWADKYLELHGIKWPVPTYLAQQATARAIKHLRADFSVGHGKARKSETAPIYLPDVHEKIRDSLYYL